MIISKNIRHAENAHVRICLAIVVRPMGSSTFPRALGCPMFVALFINAICLFSGINRRSHRIHNTSARLPPP
jgi:hypothetical protein